jgi:hypothetical protein
MKKIGLSLASILVSAALSSAQYSDLVSLGSNGWTIDTGASSSIYSQTSSSVSFTSSVNIGDPVQGSLVSTPVNWSSFNAGNGTQGSSTAFAINMSFTGTGATPQLGFTLAVWDAGFNDSITLFGSTATATSTASYIPLTFDSGNTNILANPGNIIITWQDGGTPNVTMNSFAAVPEPSTYALMALGGLVLFFIARRRKAQV